MASNSHGTLTLDLIARIGGFTGPLDNASREWQKRMEEMKKAAKQTGAAIGTTFADGVTTASAALVAMVSRQLDVISCQDELANRLRTTVDSLGVLTRAGELSGISLEQPDVDSSKVEASRDAVSTFKLALDGVEKQLTVEVFPLLTHLSKNFLDAVEAAVGLGTRVQKTAGLILGSIGLVLNAGDGVGRVYKVMSAEFDGLLSSAKGSMIAGAYETLFLLSKLPGVNLSKQLGKLETHYDAQVTAATDAAERMRSALETPLAGTRLVDLLGASDEWKSYLESASDAAGQTKGVFTAAFIAMDAAIVNFALTGKLSFGDFAKSILVDLARIEIRTATSAGLSALLSFAGTAAASYFGSPGSAGSTQAGYTGTDLSNFTPGSIQAKGGVWNSGIQKFAKGGSFSNGIVDSPSLFNFGKGTGLVGEAGPEAIMPLTRGADGKLGVQAIGGTSSVSGGVCVSINIASDGKTDVSSNQSGMESFGAAIGKFVESKYKELEAKSLSSQGNIRKAIIGRS